MKTFLKTAILIALINCQLFIANSAKAQSSEYKIANKFNVDGTEGWDYIAADDTMPRLYISHGSIVQVFDAVKGKVIGTIPDMHGVHGIAVARDIGKGFISNGKDSSVVVFDLISFNVLAKVKVTGANPDCIIYDQIFHHVYTFNGRSGSATVIDANTNKAIATIGLDGKPEFAVVDEEGKMYVNIEDKNEITIINLSMMKVEKSFPVAPGDEPSGLAIDTKNHRLFSVCGNKMMVISDYKTGKVITTVPIGDNPDAVVFDNGLKRAYSSNGEGSITVVQEVDANKFNVAETIPTMKSARTLCLYQKNHHLYLPAAEALPQIEQPKDKPIAPKRPNYKPGSFVIIDVEYIKHK
jgi:YVTN family beta-propeller protein